MKKESRSKKKFFHYKNIFIWIFQLVINFSIYVPILWPFSCFSFFTSTDSSISICFISLPSNGKGTIVLAIRFIKMGRKFLLQNNADIIAITTSTGLDFFFFHFIILFFFIYVKESETVINFVFSEFFEIWSFYVHFNYQNLHSFSYCKL